MREYTDSVSHRKKLVFKKEDREAKEHEEKRRGVVRAKSGCLGQETSLEFPRWMKFIEPPIFDSSSF